MDARLRPAGVAPGGRFPGYEPEADDATVPMFWRPRIPASEHADGPPRWGPQRRRGEPDPQKRALYDGWVAPDGGWIEADPYSHAAALVNRDPGVMRRLGWVKVRDGRWTHRSEAALTDRQIAFRERWREATGLDGVREGG